MEFGKLYLYCLRILGVLQAKYPAEVMFAEMYNGPKEIDSVVEFLRELDETTEINLESKIDAYLMDSIRVPLTKNERLMLRMRMINASYMFSALSEQVRHDGRGIILCSCATRRESLLLGLTSLWTIRKDEFFRQQAEYYCAGFGIAPPFYGAT